MLLPIAEPPRKEDLIVWEIQSGKEIFHPKGYGFISLFSPDGSRLLTFKKYTGLRLTPIEPEISVVLFDTTDWKEIGAGRLGTASSFSFSANGKRLALGGEDRKNNNHFVRIFDPKDASELYALFPKQLGDIDLSPDGKTLALAKGYGQSDIDIWDIRSHRITATLRGHTNTVNSIAFSADGRLASCSMDNTVKLWDPASNPEYRRITEPLSVYARPIALGPNGSALAFGQEGRVNIITGPINSITLVDAGSGDRGSHRLKGHSGGAKSLAYSGDGARLASSGASGEIKIWNVARREEICTYREPKGEISALSLSHDGRFVASAHEPKEITAARFGRGPFPTKSIPVDVRVWDSQTRSDRWIMTGHPAGVYRVAFSPDGSLLASSDTSTVKIWSMMDGKLVKEFPVYVSKNEPFSSVIWPSTGGSFSPKGDHLIVVASEAIQIWNLATGQPVALIQGHQSSGIRSFALSPDQTRLATSSFQEVKLWDALTGQEVLTLPIPAADRNESNNSVGALAWSADGLRLRAGLLDGSIIEWDGAVRSAK